MRRAAAHLAHAAAALLPSPRTHVGSHTAWRLLSTAGAPRCWRQCEALPSPPTAAAAAALAARRCRGFASLPHLDDMPLDTTRNSHIRDFAIIAHGAPLRRPHALSHAAAAGGTRGCARSLFVWPDLPLARSAAASRPRQDDADG
jgi:hypothetical protein